ncbi:MAG TPA: hypothetical protein VEB22_05560 [Phycisphaerales bacterium]|nr:hypothetical protein [Phycisphaerales bacterium]
MPSNSNCSKGNLDSLEFRALEPELQPRLAARRPLLYHVRNRSL